MPQESSRSRLVVIILLAACLVLVILDSREDSGPVMGGMRNAGALVFAPVASGVSTMAGPLSETYQTLAAAPGARERIDELEARNAELTAELRRRDLDGSRSEELQKLLRLAGLGGYEVVAARAVARLTPRGYSDTITLDVGTRDGIRTDMTVVNASGLVGRITEAGAGTSTVLLVTDGGSSVGVRLEQSRKIGVANGTSHSLDAGALLEFELFDADAQVEAGDRIVTLGSHAGTPFVPGVPVGTVERVQKTPGALSRTAEVAPVVDIASLDTVGVVVAGPEEDPRDSVLPPHPEEEDAADAAQAPARGGERGERGKER